MRNPDLGCYTCPRKETTDPEPFYFSVKPCPARVNMDQRSVKKLPLKLCLCRTQNFEIGNKKTSNKPHTIDMVYKPHQHIGDTRPISYV